MEACTTALDAVGNAFSLRTAKQDVGAWTAWKAYCKVMHTTPMRGPVDPITDRLGFMREVVLLTNALTYFIKTKAPVLLSMSCHFQHVPASTSKRRGKTLRVYRRHVPRVGGGKLSHALGLAGALPPGSFASGPRE